MDKGKALIIEDELIIRNFLSAILSSLGFIVVQAGTLNEGFEKHELSKPDIIFLDINLPDGSGIDLISSLKDNHPKVKIVVASSYDFEEEKKRSAAEGADFFMSKPFNQKVVELAVEAVLHS